MRSTFLGGLLMLAASLPVSVAAQECGGRYVVQAGDTLSAIAERFYGDAAKWAALKDENRDIIGQSVADVRVGMALNLPCIDGRPVDVTLAGRDAAPGPAAGAGARAISLLTAGDRAPFTDRALPGGGLITEIVTAAMEAAAPPRGFAIEWIEDRGAHLTPLLSGALMDMGFAWTRPDCAAVPDAPLCRDFLFSAPLFEMLDVLFTPAGASLDCDAQHDMTGARLCRPRGWPTDDLDRPDRRWLSEGDVTLAQPASVMACFDMLVAGDVDAVAVDEFSGALARASAGLAGQVTVNRARPLAIRQLHVIVHNSHPQAKDLIEMVDAGLRDIRASGRFQQILDDHLGRFWAGLQ